MKLAFALLLLTCINTLALTPQEQKAVEQIKEQVIVAKESLLVSNAALKSVSDALRSERERLDAASADNARLTSALTLARDEQSALQDSLRVTESQLAKQAAYIAKLEPKAEAYDRLRFALALLTSILSGALAYACLALLPLQYRIAAAVLIGGIAGGVVYGIASAL